jgi:hypothetical protein
MGWKSTIDLSRREAISRIMDRINDIENMSNNELSVLMESLGYGDNTELPLYGHNFNIIDKIPGTEYSYKNDYPDVEADGYVFCGKCGKMK